MLLGRCAWRQLTNDEVRSLSPSQRIPRPRNSFIIFRTLYCSAFTDLFPHDPNLQSTKSKDASRVWKALPDEPHEWFEDEAKEEKTVHQTRFPDYCFKLSRPRMKKSDRESGKRTQKKPKASQGSMRESLTSSCFTPSPRQELSLSLLYPRESPSFTPDSYHYQDSDDQPQSSIVPTMSSKAAKTWSDPVDDISNYDAVSYYLDVEYYIVSPFVLRRAPVAHSHSFQERSYDACTDSSSSPPAGELESAMVGDKRTTLYFAYD